VEVLCRRKQVWTGLYVGPPQPSILQQDGDLLTPAKTRDTTTVAGGKKAFVKKKALR